MSALLSFPSTDAGEIAILPDRARSDLFRWIALLRPLRAQRAGRTRVIARLAAEHHIPRATIVRKFYAWQKSDWNWRALLDKRLCPGLWRSTSPRLPGEFLEYWKTIQQEYQRHSADRAAWRELIRRWRAGKHIPGYHTPPTADPRTGVPHGWSYRNLMRHQLTKFERTAARIGRTASSSMLPKVLATRVGILPGQILVNDDQDYDAQIAFLGVNRKLSRPSGFNTLCYSSGCDILRGYKPTILNPDGTKQTLRKIDYEWHLVNLLTTIGYRPDTGTLIIDEHGTTKAGQDFEARVADATDGKVTFSRSGVHGEQICGMFRGQPRGNPGFKAARESLFNLVRNEMAALEAPTGKDRQHAPEENYGLDIYARKLFDAITERPELADKFMLPVLQWSDFLFLAESIADLINHRTDHDLEGWSRMGRITASWRLSLDQPWQPQETFLALPAPQRAIADALIRQTPALWQHRKLSPAEVWEASRGDLLRVSGAAIPTLLGPTAARAAAVTDDHQIVIQDTEIDPEPMWFDAALTNGRILEQRRPLRVYLNPYTPAALQVCDQEGRYLGDAPRVHRICKTDVDALQRRYGRVRKIESKLLNPVAARGAKKARERADMHAHNARILAGDPPQTSRLPDDETLHALQSDQHQTTSEATDLANELTKIL